jgi:hypothetical protein
MGSIAPASADTSSADPAGYSYVTQNGNPVTAIQAFGPDGQPAPVTLFDQDGAPLDTGGMGTDNLTCTGEQLVVPVPYLNSAGQPLTNAYPARGVCVTPDNVVVGAASVMTNGAPVQTWTATSLPAAGQTILVDENGVYAGLAASEVTPAPTPTGKALVTPSPSTPVQPSPGSSTR